MSRTRPTFRAVTFGRRANALRTELEALGTSVMPSDGAAALLAAVESAREVSVVIVSNDVGREEAAFVFGEVKRRYATLPIIWLGEQLGYSPLQDFRSSPDALLHEPTSAVSVHRAIVALVGQPYAETVSSLLVSLLQSVLCETFHIEAERPPVLVNATSRLVGEVNAIVAFCGAGISGCFLVSVEEATLANVHARLIPGARRADRRQAEDLAGEIANLVVGKLKYALDQLHVSCEIGIPHLVGSAGTILRRTNGQPSLVAEFTCADGIVRGELAIDRCAAVEQSRLEGASSFEPPAHDAELNFL